MWDRPRRSPAASSTRSTSSRQAHPMPSPLRPSALAVTISCAAALAGSGCDNTITSSEALPPLEMASLDSNAGSWRMIVLSGPTQFTVAAPAAETSAAYAAELAAIKTRSEEHTSELQSLAYLVCRLLLEKKKHNNKTRQGDAQLRGSATIRIPTHMMRNKSPHMLIVTPL